MHPERVKHTNYLHCSLVNYTREYGNVEIKLSKIPHTVLKMHPLNVWMENKLWAFSADVLSKVINILYFRER